jgi:hypothetical protein
MKQASDYATRRFKTRKAPSLPIPAVGGKPVGGAAKPAIAFNHRASSSNRNCWLVRFRRVASVLCREAFLKTFARSDQLLKILHRHFEQ